MIAGFYEDVSAVTKGWKDNPVEFDSLFNRSRESWAWGSPDILPMFSTRTDHMTSDCYPAEYEDFGASSAVHLDTWVFDKVDEFFNQIVPKNPELEKRLRKDKIVFFLHLLGIDTIGHARRPTSKEYIDNIIAIDTGIAKVVKLMEDFYKDDKTAYVFTADHGMADRGIHGDGDPQNTETPIVAWGAGVSRPKFSDQHRSHLVENSRPTPKQWFLDHLSRFDVTQADIAPLMATLIGVPLPVNSVGVLPTEYLEGSIDFKASALLDNAKVILVQYQAKESEKKATSNFFQPFQPLMNYNKILTQIEQLIADQEFEKAQRQTEALIAMTLEGLRYYQTYDKWFLLSIIISGYVGFMAFTTTMILQYYTASGQSYNGANFSIVATASGVILGICMIIYLSVESSPLMYYLYSIFPFAFWTIVLNRFGVWRHTFRSYFASGNSSLLQDIVTILGSLGVVHVVVYGFHRREIFAVCFWALCAWGLFVEKRLPGALKLAWTVICLVSSVFPLVPVDMGDMTTLLVASGLGVTAMSLVLCKRLLPLFNYGLNPRELSHEVASVYFHQVTAQQQGLSKISIRQWLQILLVFISTLIVYTTEKSLKSSNGLPVLNQMASWAILITSFVLLVVSGDSYIDILINTFLSIVSPMVLLSINFEVLFFATFFMFCITWIVMERYLYLASLSDSVSSPSSTTNSSMKKSSSKSEKSVVKEEAIADQIQSGFVTLQNVRVAAIYILSCFFAFFGTGNLAGFSGVELSSAFRFQTLFDPFLMGAILILKMVMPFFLLCAVFGVLIRQMNVAHQIASFLVVSLLSDSMTLDFLLQVKDSGSWLEIGLSLSNFVMLNFFLIFQMLLAGLTNILLRRLPTSLTKDDNIVRGQREKNE
jgi:phosphatidylinositol glycan class N